MAPRLFDLLTFLAVVSLIGVLAFVLVRYDQVNNTQLDKWERGCVSAGGHVMPQQNSRYECRDSSGRKISEYNG